MEILNSFFILYDQVPSNAVKGEYNYLLVLFSYIIVVVASYIAIHVLQRVNINSKKDIAKVRIIGAVVISVGIWSMHFIGMLAYQMRMAHSYNVGLTALSIVFAFVFSYIVFYNITLEKLALRRILLNAPVMGVGVSSMHYVGMAAMEMDGEIKYIQSIFVLSIIIAVCASAAAMWIMYFVAHSSSYKKILHIVAALVMGVAVCGMHYTGMAATVFIPDADCRFDDNQSHIGLAITVIVLSLSIITTMLLFLIKSVAKDGVVFSKYGFVIGTLYITLICVSLLLYIVFKNNHEYLEAVEKYRNNLHAEASIVKKNIESQFDKIYSNIRIISNLPSVRSINNNVGALSTADFGNIREIYNNLAAYVKVSEVYILSKDFNPDAIDINTGRLEEPILAFDGLIVGRDADEKLKDKSDEITSSVEKIEKYEYELIVEQIAWLKKSYPTIDSVDRINVPMIGGREVVTYGNSQYSISNPNDDDRSGMVYSIPFYNLQGKFAGVVSVVILTNVLQDLISSGGYVLLNSKYNHKIKAEEPSRAVLSSDKFLVQGALNPKLLYSDVIPLSIMGKDNEWKLWVGISDSIFIDSIGAAILDRRNFECIIILLIGGCSIVCFFFFRINYLREKEKEERKLRDNEKYFSMIANSMPCLLWLTNMYGDSIFFNKTWYDFTGRKKEYDSIRSWVYGIHSEDLPVCLEKYDDAVINQESFEMWGRIRRHDGEYRWMLIVGVSRFSEENIFEGFIVTCTDITEQRSAFDAVENERHFAQVVLNTVVDGIITVDEEGLIREFNSAAEGIFNYKAEEVIGNNVNMLVPNPHHSKHDDYLKNYLRTGEAKVVGVNREVSARKKNGDIFPIELAIRDFQVGDKEMFVGTIRDISERKKVEKELRMHRDNLQELIDEQTKKIRSESEINIFLRKIATLSNLSQDTNSAIEQSVNDICLLTGWSIGHCYLLNEEDNILYSLGTWSASAKKYPEFVRESNKISFEQGIGIPGMVLSKCKVLWIDNVQLFDGFLRKHAAVNAGLKGGIASPIFIGEKIAGVFEFFSESELYENKEMAVLMENVGMQIGRVIERNAQNISLVEAREKAEKSAQVKSEFLSNMSHELRTPMHAILNYANMSLKGVSKGDTKKLEKYLGNIQVSGNRLLWLLNNLLDLTKMDSGKMDFSFAKGKLGEVVEYTMLELDSLLKEKELKVELTIFSSNTEAVFDRLRMIQVMVNLFSNAIKFSPDSSVIRVLISDASLIDGVEVLFCSVANDGDNIPLGELEAIFEQFNQSSNTKTGAGGTGLGLAICKEILASHNGKIWAENGLCSGAVFSFVIPKL